MIRARLAKAQQGTARSATWSAKRRPRTCEHLQQLAGHLQAGLFITKFRKIFARDEMNDDLVMVPAKRGDADDDSEYEEILPTSRPLGPRPPGWPHFAIP